VSAIQQARRIDMGGDEEDRTPDLGSAIAALSQLSYTPMNRAYDSILYPYCKVFVFEVLVFYNFDRG